MTIEEIQLLCELPNYQNFADASFYLPYSPSLITKYVNNVEEELGVKIFIRSNKSRQLQLTAEGTLVIESMKRLKADYDYLKRQVNQLKNADSSKIRIGSQPRAGNIHEQTILAKFLIDNLTAQVSMHKAPADELIRDLISGRIDAAFITLHDSLVLDECFGDNRSKLEHDFLLSEKEIYAGVSDKYFPGRTEVRLKELEDFTFVFPFPASRDILSAGASNFWKHIAEEKQMDLKYINLQVYDNTPFQMAAIEKMVIPSTFIPTNKHEGIHFLRVSDWTGVTNLYFFTHRANSSKIVDALRKCALDYKNSLEKAESKA